MLAMSVTVTVAVVMAMAMAVRFIVAVSVHVEKTWGKLIKAGRKKNDERSALCAGCGVEVGERGGKAWATGGVQSRGGAVFIGVGCACTSSRCSR